MAGFAHKSINADNSSYFLLTNKVTQFKIALTQYGIVQVKTWQEMNCEGVGSFTTPLDYRSRTQKYQWLVCCQFIPFQIGNKETV